ncbi:MAG TPA: HAMP domain-containing sensor histidine kinase [Polyangiaceae bacterium]|jgi:signal transduction histidine kinase
MDTRNLEARLTVPLLGLTAGLIFLVGVSSVLVTYRTLDASDSDVARSYARSALDALQAELGEGDSFAEAAQEVVPALEGRGVRVVLRSAGVTAGDSSLPAPAPGACTTVAGEHGQPWRACAASGSAGAAVAAIPVAAHRAAVTALARGMVGVVCVALLLVLLAIHRAIRQPIAELSAAVAWTGRIVDAESPTPPPLAATTEVAQLEAAFDALVRRLIDALARERASSAHIAHELRTPLTAMVTDLESVRGMDEASSASLARVRADLAHFAYVIDAILVLSETPPTAASVRRASTVVNVADVVRELAPDGAVVEAPDEALVDADEHLVRLAVRNLVDNAGKYGGGARRLRVSRADGAVRLTVIDEGPGVGPRARERMFERYWRGTADGEGRGLGLALVRAVAERHGGLARADAGTDGRGLSMSLTLGGLIEWHEVP